MSSEASIPVDDVGRILHVAESFGGGVGSALLDYVASTPEYEHHLLYAERADAPIAVSDLQAFAATTVMPDGHLSRVATARRVAEQGAFRFVHAHSSFGGLYARLAVRRSRRPIVYTPHCYAFERADLNAPARLLYKFVEFALSFNTTTFAACSPREAALSRWTSSTSAVFVPNVAAPLAAGRRPSSNYPKTIRVVGAGRSARQKDPSFFVECVRTARASGLNIEATWVGGDDKLRRQVERDGIWVTGWLPRASAVREVAHADLYLHSAAWEGFPIAVLESLALDVPTVVREIPAFEGVPLPKVSTPEEFSELLTNASQQRTLEHLLNQGKHAVADFSASAQRSALRAVYGTASPRA